MRLDVYDMTGRHVAELVNEQINAGQHRVTFNAMNLSSGVYIYRLQAGNEILTRKLTIIK
ncbi:MAG: T9SS C-terminal target domain-containing protein [Balneolaceae bacterium]|nr:MAG: T9SS C-terminal target domain-containing protein [Balneolaceae bacterium]